MFQSIYSNASQKKPKQQQKRTFSPLPLLLSSFSLLSSPHSAPRQSPKMNNKSRCGNDTCVTLARLGRITALIGNCCCSFMGVF